MFEKFLFIAIALFASTNAQIPTFFVRFAGDFKLFADNGHVICSGKGEDKENFTEENRKPVTDSKFEIIDENVLRKVATECKLANEIKTLEFRFFATNGDEKKGGKKGFYRVKMLHEKVKFLRHEIDALKTHLGAHIVILYNNKIGQVLQIDNFHKLHDQTIALVKFDGLKGTMEMKKYGEEVQANPVKWDLDAHTIWDFDMRHDQQNIHRVQQVVGEFMSFSREKFDDETSRQKSNAAKFSRQTTRRGSMHGSNTKKKY